MDTSIAALRVLAEAPIAIRAESLTTYLDLLTTPPDANGPRAAARSQPRGRPVGVGLYGPLFPHPNILTEYFGFGTALDQFAANVRAMADDPSVSEIVLHVDSPGGSVYGTAEAADAVRAAAAVKPVTAAVDSVAASAAYWIAAQASELVVTPGGEVGSIGVFQMHMDTSKALAMAGKSVSLVSAGERKTAGHPYGPLDDMGRGEIQAGVDDYYAMFVKAVARGRNTSASAVKNGFGRGGMVRAEQAVREGMADRVASFDQVVNQKLGSSSRASASGRAALSESDRIAIEIRKRRLLLNAPLQTTTFRERLAAALSPPAHRGQSVQAPTRDAAVWGLALHEAGHGCAAVALGIPFESLSITPTADTGGRMNLHNPSKDLRDAGEQAVAIMLWAGPAAELLNEFNRRCADLGDADRRCMAVFGPSNVTSERQAQGDAEQFVKNHMHAVRLVAAKLIESRTGTLSSELVEAHCRQAGLIC